MQNVKICSHCSQPNRADALDCIQCGHAFRVYVTVSHEPPPPPQLLPQKTERVIPVRYFKSAACFLGAFLAMIVVFYYVTDHQTGGYYSNPIYNPASIAPSAPQYAPGSVVSTALWHDVKLGMTQAQVLNMIGDPDRMEPNGATGTWTYTSGEFYLVLIFNERATVQSIRAQLPATY